jgi:hypothetical protein
MLKGVFAVGAGEAGKAVHLYATQAIPDLSKYKIGVANNGGGTDGPEVDLPAVSAQAGDDIIVVRHMLSPLLTGTNAHLCPAEFDVRELLQAPNDIKLSQSGNDAIELFEAVTDVNGVARMEVIDTFGDINVDGTGSSWDYHSSWAFRTHLAPGGNFNPDDWVHARA